MSTSNFDPAIDELAPRVLHAQADDWEITELGRILAQSSGNRRRFLDHMALHSLLRQEAQAGAFAENAEEHFRVLEKACPKESNRILKFWLPTAAAAAAACLTVVALLPMSASAALERVVTAMGQAVDRTYRIDVLEPAESDAPQPRNDRGRYPASSHLDGATLWLRSPGQFVLRQMLPGGETRILGSDGAESWSLRGSGAAQVSEDPERFGGGLVAKRPEIAFVDLQGHLDELGQFYDLSWIDRSDPGLWKLRGIRKSNAQGGAREIELWFHPGSGLLQRMILRQLPRGNGGPRSLAVVLESTEPLPPDFFKHTYPHLPRP
jgi:hypothetical protein